MFSNNDEKWYSKTYKKTSSKSAKFKFSSFAKQNCTDWPFSTSGGAQNSFQAENSTSNRALKIFFKKFSKLSSKFWKIITIFLKKLKFLARFHSGLSFASPWCPSWFLQKLANAIVSGEKSAENGQNWNSLDKFFFQKTAFLIGFNQKSPLLDPHKFCRQPFHIVVNTCQKLTISEEKSKII